MADSARWERFTFRPDDVVISTPSKCGTSWMQTIVGMLLLDRIDLGAPISTISPWLDMLTRTDDQVFGLLERQEHRRFIKTHSPLDGVPRLESVTYFAVARHPLDVALSDRDHRENMHMDHAIELRTAASGPVSADTTETEPEPDDPADYLRWFIDNDEQPVGSGPYGLEDYCQQIGTYWGARHAPNVHLFHYTDMWNELDREMRRVAAALDVAIDEERWPAFVEAAGLTSMRSRAAHTAPEADVGMWVSPERFFRSGGTRDWASLLTPDDIAHFEERLRELAEDAAEWATRGRVALDRA
ncbi:MAG: sulfotransferase domain-containing protein [Actinomycetota bacterium]